MIKPLKSRPKPYSCKKRNELSFISTIDSTGREVWVDLDNKKKGERKWKVRL